MIRIAICLAAATLAACPANAQSGPMTWCAATVSGIPGRQKTYYSPLFPTPDDSSSLEKQFKAFIVSQYAPGANAVVDTQCQGQQTEATAAAVRKANAASDGRLSTIVEVGWRP